MLSDQKPKPSQHDKSYVWRNDIHTELRTAGFTGCKLIDQVETKKEDDD